VLKPPVVVVTQPANASVKTQIAILMLMGQMFPVPNNELLDLCIMLSVSGNCVTT
jgi:hypothetical protein